LTVQRLIDEAEQLSPDFNNLIHLPTPPVKVYQMPEDPVNTRVIKRNWENLLYEAAKKLVPFGETFLRSKRDIKGVVTLEYPDFLLVARQYIWREVIVSIHETVLKYAVGKGKHIVMYISDNNWFIKLDPKRILMDEETKDNIRGSGSSQRMKNFNIRIGERVFLPQTKLKVKI